MLEVLDDVGDEAGGEDHEHRPDDGEEHTEVDPPAEPEDGKREGEGAGEPAGGAKQRAVRPGGEDDRQGEYGRLEPLAPDRLEREQSEAVALPPAEGTVGARREVT